MHFPFGIFLLKYAVQNLKPFLRRKLPWIVLAILIALMGLMVLRDAAEFRADESRASVQEFFENEEDGLDAPEEDPPPPEDSPSEEN